MFSGQGGGGQDRLAGCGGRDSETTPIHPQGCREALKMEGQLFFASEIVLISLRSLKCTKLFGFQPIIS